MEQQEESKCSAVKMRPTATGEVAVRCAKRQGHVEAGDPEHKGWTGVFPLTWRD
jgi:hypothetical protein